MDRTAEVIRSEIDALIPKAESGAQWAEICRLEQEAIAAERAEDRPTLLESLADDISSGTFQHRRVCLSYVLRAVLDEPLLDWQDTASLICGDREDRADILLRAEQVARSVVVRWLTDEAEGRALVTDEAERRAAEAIEDVL